MKSACFIPIKSNSERVPGKNFRELNGKRLYQYICEHVQEADVFDDIYVDTNSEEVKEYASKKGFVIIERKEELAKSTANGNDFLFHNIASNAFFDTYIIVNLTGKVNPSQPLLGKFTKRLSFSQAGPGRCGCGFPSAPCPAAA